MSNFWRRSIRSVGSIQLVMFVLTIATTNVASAAAENQSAMILNTIPRYGATGQADFVPFRDLSYVSPGIVEGKVVILSAGPTRQKTVWRVRADCQQNTATSLGGDTYASDGTLVSKSPDQYNMTINRNSDLYTENVRVYDFLCMSASARQSTPASQRWWELVSDESGMTAYVDAELASLPAAGGTMPPKDDVQVAVTQPPPTGREPPAEIASASAADSGFAQEAEPRAQAQARVGRRTHSGSRRSNPSAAATLPANASSCLDIHNASEKYSTGMTGFGQSYGTNDMISVTNTCKYTVTFEANGGGFLGLDLRVTLAPGENYSGAGYGVDGARRGTE